MIDEPVYDEELFGILTDDSIYLDCTLIKPAGLRDEETRALRVWVPRYPLTKTSVIACARQEVQAAGPGGTVSHLIFDLRGTGYSDGDPRDRNFEQDLQGIQLWAAERFGNIQVSFMGLPDGSGKARILPVRPAVVMESYVYEPERKRDLPPVIYLSTYGKFGQLDDARCAALAQAGYLVYGMDPLRYLLHASALERLTVPVLTGDFRSICRQLPRSPILVGQPVAAGLALLWAAGVEEVAGVVAIGRTQLAFRPDHIFHNDNPHTFFLSRYVGRIAPRPVMLVIQEGSSLGGDNEEMAALYQSINGPRKLLHTREISPEFLLQVFAWLQKQGRS